MSLLRSSIFVLIAALMLGLGLWALTHNNRTVAIIGSRSPGAIQLNLSGALNASDSADTDGDGLLDWAELLWGTDPKNPDSDSDGYKDGEEIAKGYDPTKPGEARLQTQNPGASADPNQNLTQAMASLLGLRVLSENQTILNDPGTNKVLKSQNLSESELIELLRDVNSGSALALSVDIPKTIPPNPQGRRYAAEVTKIVNEELRPIGASIPGAMQGAARQGELAAIKRIIQAHETAMTRISALQPPSGWESFHEAERQILAESYRFFEDIAKAKEDPMRALLAMRRYQSLAKRSQELEQLIRKALLST